MRRPRSIPASAAERRGRNRRGRVAELAAAALLMSKGYRIVARRHRTALGEIDIIAAGRGRIVFVEVKQRRTNDDPHAAVSDHQIYRIHNAADLWLGRNARFQGHRIGFDLVLVSPWRLPRHFPDAF